jgi:hypothetical protein
MGPLRLIDFAACYVEELKLRIKESSIHIMQGRKLQALPNALPVTNQYQVRLSLVPIWMD